SLMREYCTACRCVSSGNTSDLPRCPETKARVQAFLTSFTERTFILNQQFLKIISSVLNALASMPTSRTVIFLSNGFNRFPGREVSGILTGYGPKEQFQYNPHDTQPDLDAVLKIATANNIKFYTIDSRGLYTASTAPGSGFDASSSSRMHTQMDARGTPNLA